MMIKLTPLEATWAILFVVAGAFAVIGNIVLFYAVRSRRPVPFAWGGMMAFLYFMLPPAARSRSSDKLAGAVLLSIAFAIVAAYLLYPTFQENGSL